MSEEEEVVWMGGCGRRRVIRYGCGIHAQYMDANDEWDGAVGDGEQEIYEACIEALHGHETQLLLKLGMALRAAKLLWSDRELRWTLTPQQLELSPGLGALRALRTEIEKNTPTTTAGDNKEGKRE